jgi:class 3 adenylate cyclase
VTPTSELHPEAGYARLGGDRIAYQTVGEGPPDLVLSWGSFSNADVDWDDPDAARFYRRLAEFCRLIRYDRRGTAGSDRLVGGSLPPWESYVEELVAVMDEVGSERAAIMGVFDGGPMAALFAATKPERALALILANTSARFVMSDDYPYGMSPDVLEQVAQSMEDTWGTEDQVWMQVPSRADDAAFRRWYAKYLRTIATPGAVGAFFRALADADARAILPSVHVPTLVLHRRDYPLLSIEHGRYLADHIPGASFVDLAGSDAPLIWEGADRVVDEVRSFLTGTPASPDPDRVLATVLFTDIVASTERARELGDRRWRELLERHDEAARRHVERSRGTLVKSTGDGILATFDGPGRGIRCATGLGRELDDAGLRVRAGLHTGEVEARPNDVSGLAVHIAARVMALATPGEVWVSRTVRDLVVGSEIVLEERGTHNLKGIEGPWELFSVVSA